jgi:hypothetical protein
MTVPARFENWAEEESPLPNRANGNLNLLD